MARFLDFSRRLSAIRRGAKATRSPRAGRPSVEGLESRQVLSGIPAAASVQALQRQVAISIRAFAATGGAAPGGETTIMLAQDVRRLGQAFGVFDASFLRAASALRTTATSASGPSQPGLSAYQAAIASAVSTLDATIATDLADLPRTGGTLAASIDVQVASLQAGSNSAGAGLADSSGTSLVALQRQGNAEIAATLDRATSAIFADNAGMIPSSALLSYDQASASAFDAFRTSITSAENEAIAAQTRLDPTEVASAVFTLQNALYPAINSLGTSLTSSADNPTATVSANLNNLHNTLIQFPAPKTFKVNAVKQFQGRVATALKNYQAAINEAVVASLQNYNGGRL